MRYPSSQKGFTLIELSIVLVIIGLISGGILFGRDLIKTAERRALMRDIENYRTAMQTFKLKYGYMPGDIPNATQIWGEKPGANCDNQVASEGLETCNGDDNGQLTYVPPTLGNSEGWCIWQHLSNAELIDGSYTCSGYSSPTFGSGEGNSDYLARFYAGYQPGTDFFPTYNMIGRNLLVVRGQGLNYPALRAATTYYVDSKEDDGFPFMGSVQTVNYLAFPPVHHVRFENCTTGSDTEARYNIQNQEINCTLGTNSGM